MESAMIQSIARSIAGKAAARRGDNFDAAIGKIKAVVQQALVLSERTDLPKKNLVLVIQQNSEAEVEYGFIMFVLQNLLDSGLPLDNNLKQTINQIFSSVSDIRDHRYRFGPCQCFSCRKQNDY